MRLRKADVSNHVSKAHALDLCLGTGISNKTQAGAVDLRQYQMFACVRAGDLLVCTAVSLDTVHGPPVRDVGDVESGLGGVGPGLHGVHHLLRRRDVNENVVINTQGLHRGMWLVRE